MHSQQPSIDILNKTIVKLESLDFWKQDHRNQASVLRSAVIEIQSLLQEPTLELELIAKSKQEERERIVGILKQNWYWNLANQLIEII